MDNSAICPTMRMRTSAAIAAVAVAMAGPARHGTGPSGSGRYGRGDTGVVTVSRETHNSEGEEPLAVNPLNPDDLTVVANVFQPNLPGPAGMYVGGAGVQDSRLYVTTDGGRHWKTWKLDVGGLGPIVFPPPPGAIAPEFSDAGNVLNSDPGVAWDRHGNAYFESGDVHGVHHGGNEVETVWRSVDGGRSWGPRDGYTAVNATMEDHTELDRSWI